MKISAAQRSTEVTPFENQELSEPHGNVSVFTNCANKEIFNTMKNEKNLQCLSMLQKQYPGAYLRNIVKNRLDSTGPNCFCPLCAVCNSFTNLISARSKNESFYLSRWLHAREQINVVDRKWEWSSQLSTWHRLCVYKRKTS